MIDIDTVKDGIVQFESCTDSQIKRAINTAKKVALNDHISNDMLENATLLYARHILVSENFMSYWGTTSSTTLGNAQTMTDKTNSDAFLVEYQQIANKFGDIGFRGDVISRD
ncbi:hypothetical protein DY120_07270 [Apilactobacillus micheneri]|uniref:Uncharacterized protein n=1 Tax=Apilactobacillus micheneri TaxID=1899430 RepID=A0ABY2YZF6_9LACO|nr:hypothetical protein [Apilactobacillus micheneri]TPR23098.1 hypothetical protein DY114_07255 [Apilactobacillus micheneri]TPR24416.1 hypothetical protein DY111_07270 [Apilactobacillus micheneri]TPR29363.1 hypothetical protein DY120_07270 [Apilactobacillus micheneri]TPR34570.1 hypothetical protein DY027_07260 [Apilactobacillus micheneri]